MLLYLLSTDETIKNRWFRTREWLDVHLEVVHHVDKGEELDWYESEIAKTPGDDYEITPIECMSFWNSYLTSEQRQVNPTFIDLEVCLIMFEQ